MMNIKRCEPVGNWFLTELETDLDKENLNPFQTLLESLGRYCLVYGPRLPEMCWGWRGGLRGALIFELQQQLRGSHTGECLMTFK